MANGRKLDPQNREEFKTYIRAKLGEPVINLEVSEFQVDIAVDEALQYFQNYHYLGSTHSYYVYEITQADINSKSFTLPSDVLGVTTVYDFSTAGGLGLSADVYSQSWQMTYDLVFNQNVLNGSFATYYTNKTYYDMIDSLINGMKSIRFNQYENKVFLDNTWENYKVGDKLVVDCFIVLDPDDNPEIWADRWLVRYATAKLQKQWGENISKYDGTLPGGMKLNYERILSEAINEIKEIEDNCLRDYSEPPRDFVA